MAITSGTRDLQRRGESLWQKLLPTMQAGPLPADDPSDQKLKQTLAGLTMHPQTGAADPSVAVMGWSGRGFIFPENKQKIESAALEFDKAGQSRNAGHALDNGVEQRTGWAGAWIKGRMAYGDLEEQRRWLQAAHGRRTTLTQ